METRSNRKRATARFSMGALQAGTRAAGASAARPLPLCLMLTLLMTGCLVVPIPANRPCLGARTNVTQQTANELGTQARRLPVQRLSIENNNSFNRIINCYLEPLLWQDGVHEHEYTQSIRNVHRTGHGNDRITKRTLHGQDEPGQPGSARDD
jgi:hypothetical protein